MGIESAEPKSASRACNLNWGLLFPKANFFFLYGASAIILPSFSVFGRELGLGAASIGLVLTVAPFVIFLLRPFIASISDKLQRIKPVLISVILFEAVCVLLISSIPRQEVSVEQDARLSLQLNLTDANAVGSFVEIERKSCIAEPLANTTTDCSLTCPCRGDNWTIETNVSKLCRPLHFASLQPVSENATNAFHLMTNESGPLSSASLDFGETVVMCETNCSAELQPCPKRDVDSASAAEDVHLLQFWLFLILTCLIRTAISSAFSLSDTACFQQLGDHHQDYGLQRLWGTVGWGIIAPLSGLLVDFVGAYRGYKSDIPGFYMAVGLMVVQCVVSCRWKLGPTKRTKNILSNVSTLLREPKHLCFLLDIFVVGSCSSIHWYYIYWYLQDLKASKLLMGLTLATQSFLGDLPFMFLSGWLIGKLQHINVVRLAFVGFFIKFLGYSFMHNPWWAIAIELLQGPTYGSFYIAMTSYARSISVPGTEATFLSIIQGVFDCLGIAAGSCLAGLGLSAFGARKTYFIASFVPLIWLVLTVIIHQLITRCDNSGDGKATLEEPMGSAEPFMSSKSSGRPNSEHQTATEQL